MNFANVNLCDTANGPGCRVSLFVSGCFLKCHNCFNQEAQDFNYGKPYTGKTQEIILKEISKPYIAGLSLLGGDPMCQNEKGLQVLVDLTKEIHSLGKTVWLWTGFKWEDLIRPTRDIKSKLQYDLLKNCDFVVDGSFIETQKDLTLAFRGSSNQRIINVKKTFANTTGEVILYGV